MKLAKRLIRLSTTLDKKGLTKSADAFDKITIKLAQHDDEYDDLDAEWDRMEMEEGGLEALQDEYDIEESMEDPEAEALLQQMKDFLTSDKLKSVSEESKMELMSAMKALEIELEEPQNSWGGFPLGQAPGTAVELPTAEAGYAARLLKVANRLDEKGLTKEADIIDRIAEDLLK